MSLKTIKEWFKQVGSRLNGFAKLLLVTFCFVSLVVLLDSGGRYLNQHVLGIQTFDRPFEYTYVTVSSNADMEEVLKLHGLWHIKKSARIKPVVFSRYPARLKDTETAERKRIFLHVLLPAALIAREEIRRDRKFLINAIVQINKDAEAIDFDPEVGGWQRNLTESSVNRLIDISEKYEEVNAASLLTKVDIIPVSLILAQSAIESAWGSSRFTLHGNNIFGIWTWGDDGMIPEERAAGLNHKVAVFDSLLDSVRAYALMLNKLSAYQRFRDIRNETRDPLYLAEGLLNYSSRRESYVADVKTVIRQNFLKKYDTNILASGI
jgi:Bax protein